MRRTWLLISLALFALGWSLLLFEILHQIGLVLAGLGGAMLAIQIAASGFRPTEAREADVTRSELLRLELREENRSLAERLERSEMFATRMLDALPEPLHFKNRQHGWILANDAFCRLAGRAREELLGRTDFEARPPDEARAAWEADEAVLTSMRPSETEEWLTDSLGVRRRVAIRRAPFRDARNELLLATTVHDLGEASASRDALEAAKAAAERSASSKGEFLATLGHEVRNPLQAMLGATDLLATEPIPPSARELVRLLHRSGTSLLQIVDDILELARLEAGLSTLRDEPFDLPALLAEVAELFRPLARERGGEIVWNSEVGVGLSGDAARVRQILANLLSNAVRHAGSSRITITASCTEVGAERGRLVMEVRDTGPGFSPDQAELLTRKWHRGESSPGTGLGLSIVSQLAQAMGGELSAEGRPGEGALFRVELRMRTLERIPVPPPDRAPQADDSVGPGLETPLRVLVAEDNRTNQTVLKRQLQKLGCSVLLAEDGLEALELFREGGIDLVLMDCQMPRLDGHEATRRIRAWEAEQELPRTPILAVTALSFQEERERCLDSGMDDILAKPIRGSRIAEALRHFSPERTERREELPLPACPTDPVSSSSVGPT